MKTYRVGLVGCGGIAQVHGAVLQELPGVELIACADIRPERARDFAEKYGGRAYASLEAMLEGEQLDSLHIWKRPPCGWGCAFITGTTRASTC